ncbi:2S sulfur-rich seed storage protein 2-like [Solanum pennellii]|uniref:2S sulfur-rich seed storage protein 2-like n=1 Tax=Solanum pennellii TaxID=28526 RepID=A0ABM1H5L0_SOLPN|nr:2S sulfur-rich seed storage protein 2-like [Solanum pennellii]
MGKISLAALLLFFWLAVTTANMFTVTDSVTEDDIENQGSRSCQEQIHTHRLNHCRMLLSRNELSMVTEDDDEIRNQQEHLQQCCQELRNIDTHCRCLALKTMVTREPELMSQRARSLPRACNIEPTECYF